MKNDLVTTNNKNLFEKAKSAINKGLIAYDAFTKFVAIVREYAPEAKEFVLKMKSIYIDAKVAWIAINDKSVALTSQSTMQ